MWPEGDTFLPYSSSNNFWTVEVKVKVHFFSHNNPLWQAKMRDSKLLKDIHRIIQVNENSNWDLQHWRLTLPSLHLIVIAMHQKRERERERITLTSFKVYEFATRLISYSLISCHDKGPLRCFWIPTGILDCNWLRNFTCLKKIEHINSFTDHTTRLRNRNRCRCKYDTTVRYAISVSNYNCVKYFSTLNTIRLLSNIQTRRRANQLTTELKTFQK